MAESSDGRAGRKTVIWVLLAVPIICVLAIVGTLVTVSVQNDGVARGIEEELLAMPLPEGAKLAGSFSEVGRWAGGGNGTMFLGAILVHSDLQRAEIETFYTNQSELGQGNETFHPRVVDLNDPGHSMKERTFRERLGEHVGEPQYYIVFASAEAPSALHYEADIRGH